MMIIFERDNYAIVYALDKILSFASENQYLFIANCTRWIAGVIGLDREAVVHIDNVELRRPVGHRNIHPISRDIPSSELLPNSLVQKELSENTVHLNSIRRSIQIDSSGTLMQDRVIFRKALRRAAKKQK
jgi:hypothetical protein